MKPTSERNRIILAEYEQGATVRELAEKFDLAPGTVNHVLVATRKARLHKPLPVDRDVKETVALMKRYGVPVNDATKQRCFEMTERAIRLYGKYWQDKEYYEDFGGPV